MTALLLKNGEFVACVYKGLVDEFAHQAVRAVAHKIFKIARKKFSKLLIHVNDRKITAWDYYCYGLSKGNSAYSDKFIGDFIRLALIRKLEAVEDTQLRLIEISQLRVEDIDETTVLPLGSAHDAVRSELRRMMVDYGALIPSAAQIKIPA